MTRRRIDWSPVDHLLGHIRDGWIVRILAARGVAVGEAVVTQHRLKLGIQRRRTSGLTAKEEFDWLAENYPAMAEAVKLKQPGTPAEG